MFFIGWLWLKNLEKAHLKEDFTTPQNNHESKALVLTRVNHKTKYLYRSFLRCKGAWQSWIFKILQAVTSRNHICNTGKYKK